MEKVLIFGQMDQSIQVDGIKESIYLIHYLIHRMNGKGCLKDENGINWSGEFMNGKLVTRHAFVKIPS